MKISEHFDSSEFVCHCGCEQMIIDVGLLAMAENLREHIGKPMIVNCVNRCKKHNAAVNGHINSYHIKGLAMDFRVKGLKIFELHLIVKKLWKDKKILSGGLGVYSWGCHIDVKNYRTWNE